MVRGATSVSATAAVVINNNFVYFDFDCGEDWYEDPSWPEGGYQVSYEYYYWDQSRTPNVKLYAGGYLINSIYDSNDGSGDYGHDTYGFEVWVDGVSLPYTYIILNGGLFNNCYFKKWSEVSGRSTRFDCVDESKINYDWDFSKGFNLFVNVS